jgi:hypothetical protein
MNNQLVAIIQLGGTPTPHVADFLPKGHGIQQQSISCLGLDSTIQEVFSFECLLQDHPESGESSIPDPRGRVQEVFTIHAEASGHVLKDIITVDPLRGGKVEHDLGSALDIGNDSHFLDLTERHDCGPAEPREYFLVFEHLPEHHLDMLTVGRESAGRVEDLQGQIGSRL